jgi:tetratricopeptide (TPR) repeat protein
LLADYFQHDFPEGQPYSGHRYRSEKEHHLQVPVLLHRRTGIKVLDSILDLRGSSEPDSTGILLFHYTGQQRATGILRDGVIDATRAITSLHSQYWNGLCVSSKEPATFDSRVAVLRHTHWSSGDLQPNQVYSEDTPEHDRCDGDHNEICNGHVDAKRHGDVPNTVDYCIPVFVPIKLAYQGSEADADKWIIQTESNSTGNNHGDKRGDQVLQAKWQHAHLQDMHGATHPDTLASLAALVGVLQEAGRCLEAMIHHQVLMQLMQKLHGPDHPETLRVVSMHGELLLAQGQLQEAEACHRRVLQLSETVLGQRHPDTLASTNRLAGLLQSAGRLEEAGALFRRCIQLSEEANGSKDPETLLFQGNLTTLLISSGSFQEAERLCNCVLEGRMEVLGPTHPDTLTALNELGLLEQGMGNHAAAELHLRRALDLQEQLKGLKHPDTLISVNNLACLLQVSGKSQDAEPLYRRIFQVSEELLGSSHLDTLIAASRLGMLLLYDLGQPWEAEELLQASLRGMDDQLGPSHEQTQTARRALSHLMKQRDHLKQQVKECVAEME